MAGPAGSGKTVSSLLLGFGLLQAAHPELEPDAIWDRICLIDTENKSGSLFAGANVNGTRIGEFLTIDLAPPFTPQRYLEAIKVAEQGQVDVLIIDSLSHAWAGEGGMLDMKEAVAKRSGNGYTAWKEITPLHNRLIDAILQSKTHVILCLRAKAEYVIEENDKGKKVPRKVGMAPVFREGVEYEVTTFFDVGIDHTVSVSKDRTMLFDGQPPFQITPETGALIQAWLSLGNAQPTQTDEKQTGESIAALVDQVMKAYCEGLSREEKEQVASELREITGGTANYRGIRDEAVLRRIYNRFKGDTL